VASDDFVRRIEGHQANAEVGTERRGIRENLIRADGIELVDAVEDYDRYLDCLCLLREKATQRRNAPRGDSTARQRLRVGNDDTANKTIGRRGSSPPRPKSGERRLALRPGGNLVPLPLRLAHPVSFRDRDGRLAPLSFAVEEIP